MKPFFTLFIYLLATNTSFAQNKTSVTYNDIYDGKITIIGELGKPFGTIVIVKGVLVDYFSKRGDSGPNLIVQMIDDSATQQFIQIPILSFFGLDDNPIAKLEFGATYEFRVFEEGWYAGTPQHMYDRMLSAPQVIRYDTTKDGVTATVSPGYVPQSSPFHFQNRLFATDWEKIDPIAWCPELFTEKKGLLNGVAKNEDDTAIVEQGAWKIKLPGLKKWEDAIIGKPAEVYGLFRKTANKNIYALEAGWAQPVNVEDQVGQVVKMRAKVINLNGNWWLNYRGTDIYVEDMDKLPGWSTNSDYRLIEITGLLEKMDKNYGDKQFHYIVKNASWAPTEGLLLPELLYYKESVIY